ncbi:hypothetical protein EUTSA_v10005046mg [Eutrema salsugineum]|uniref:Chlorophyll a-b binding protein, chloroplastic n=1 Tax=Eutrema salsugineum TaxID=72664 RepID=V4MJW7_EUTSA|nr:hypothetical protein EUTSA_v10005046mg [Eutrema salsugineum]
MATVTTQAPAAVFRPCASRMRFLTGSSGRLNRDLSVKPIGSSTNTASFKIEAKKGEWLPGLASPGYLTGSLAGDNGFDPLALAEDPENLKWFVQAELVNGRWAMLGVAGMLLPEVFTKIGIINAPEWYDDTLHHRRHCSLSNLYVSITLRSEGGKTSRTREV